MKWILTYTDEEEKERAIYHEENGVKVISNFVAYMKEMNCKNFRVFRIDEEIDINVSYPDYFGGDDSGGCP
jgi:hypothetical protein